MDRGQLLDISASGAYTQTGTLEGYGWKGWFMTCLRETASLAARTENQKSLWCGRNVQFNVFYRRTSAQNYHNHLKRTNLSMLAGIDGTIIRIDANSVAYVNCYVPMSRVRCRALHLSPLPKYPAKYRYPNINGTPLPELFPFPKTSLASSIFATFLDTSGA